MMKMFSILFLYLMSSFNHHSNNTEHYLFLGHVYNATHTIQPKIAEINFSNYDRIWLGGDILIEGGNEIQYWQNLDTLIGISQPQVQYALGNHDIRDGNIQWYEEITKRKSYNYYIKNSTISVCLNTMLNPSMCEELNNQFDLIKNICDTITDSKHLFFFFHNGIWGQPDTSFPGIGSYAHDDLKYWNANCDNSQTTFLNVIYPMLNEVVNRNINVYCILGDTGTNSKKFYKQSDTGVHFFASGIYQMESEKNNVLIFDHDLQSDIVTWGFHDVDSLLAAQ